ncbi:Z1 domain-containing protein [Streptomyces gardneri]|uniref:Z1 domain-containing protein n=1 Tax=Streptomyces gardneri TaxID=66892 RepID=UPI0035DFE6F3
MTRNNKAFHETFRLVLELSQPIARLEQLGLDPAEIEALVRARVQERETLAARMAEPTGLRQSVWYAGPSDTDVYWPAFVNQLTTVAAETSTFGDLDRASSRIVSHLHHPKEPSFSTRGLVLTHPQSGTTTNIAAVIAKAADQGYRLFIVLTGIHNAMRRQTQQRLTRQLIASHPEQWMELTTSEHDFKPHYLNPAAILRADSAPILCVVKKNATVLRKLSEWLTHAASLLHECPALIIDTDVNQPSVASTSITPLIHRMLGTLPRAAYLGYATTPLSTLLLEPGAEDLFPEDFIVALPRPGQYTGPEVLFGREEDDSEGADDGFNMIRMIPDRDVPHLRPVSRTSVEDFAPDLPATLRHAIEYFLMAVAARKVRGSGTPHNTMLIHTSVTTNVHNSFLAPLRELLADTALLLGSSPYRAHLRHLWEQETHQVTAEDFGLEAVSFDELFTHLPIVLRDCCVTTDNSSSNDHHDGVLGPVTAIVVGGTTLARGLALEGMTVGYFVPAVTPYDTLQQMTRWFGTRTGYADLPRIWMTAELSEWWREIVGVESELRLQLERAAEDGISPLSLAMRVRSHPKLRFVRAAKQGQPIPRVSYGGRRVQTHRFRTNARWLRTNLEAARTLVAASAAHASHVQASPDLGRYIFFNVPSDRVIDFLTTYQFHEGSPETDPSLLIDYIGKRIRMANSLRQWNVAILGKPAETDDDTLTFADGITVGRIIRTRLSIASDDPDFADIKTLMSRRDAAIDLGDGIGDLNEQEIREARRRQLPHTGLLALYPIDRTSATPGQTNARRASLNAEEHVIGVGMVFPHPDYTDSTV